MYKYILLVETGVPRCLNRRPWGEVFVEHKDRTVISEPQLSTESLYRVLKIVNGVDGQRYAEDVPRLRDLFESVIKRMV